MSDAAKLVAAAVKLAHRERLLADGVVVKLGLLAEEYPDVDADDHGYLARAASIERDLLEPIRAHIRHLRIILVTLADRLLPAERIPAGAVTIERARALATELAPSVTAEALFYEQLQLSAQIGP